MNKHTANLILLSGVLTSFGFGKKGGKNAQIKSLLDRAEREYRKGGNVDKIVGSFAQAQSMIHNPSWKADAEVNPEKMAIVTQFTKLGQELSS